MHVKKRMAILLFTTLMISNAGAASSSIIPLCPGENLTLVCSTDDTITNRKDRLQWSVTVPHINSESILVSNVSIPRAIVIPNIIIPFNITRDSTNGTVPVVSTLRAVNVSADLNGTIVECTTDTGRNELIMNTIHIIGTGYDGYPWPLVTNRTHRFKDDGIKVFLKLRAENSVMYNISTTPQASIEWTSGTSIELRVSYNISYDVTVFTTLCEQNSTSMNVLPKIFFVRCTNPVHSGAIIEYSSAGDQESDIYLEGANISLACPPGEVLIGPNTATCMGNGEWKPDLDGQVLCKANCSVPIVKSRVILSDYNSTLEGSPLIFWCEESPNNTFMAECQGNGSWSADLVNHDCIENSVSSLIIILGTVIGVILLILCFSLAVIAVVKILWKDSRSRKIQIDNGSKTDSTYNELEHISMVGHCNPASMGEYSLVQPHDLSEEIAPRPSDSKDERGHNKLIYADIGPKSLETRPHITTPLDTQSHKVEYAQLNYCVQNNIQKMIPDSKMEVNQLQIDTLLNLDSLLIQLRHEVTPKWYQFGEAIGVGKDILDKCIKYSPEESIVEILDNWLRNHAGQPTWREITEALRVINLQQLAFNIEKVYDTGKLPIEINMNEVPQRLFFDDSETELPPPLPPRL